MEMEPHFFKPPAVREGVAGPARVIPITVAQRDVTPVAMVSPNVGSWRICGVCSDTEDVKLTHGGNKVFKFDVTDKDGDTIRVTAFGDNAERVHAIVERHQPYFVSGGSVEEVDKECNDTGHDYELVLDEDSQVTPCHKFKLKPHPMDCVLNQEKEKVDVLGTINYIDAGVYKFAYRPGKPSLGREARLVDETGKNELLLSLWDDLAIDFSAKYKGHKIAIMGEPFEECKEKDDIRLHDVTPVRMISPHVDNWRICGVSSNRVDLITDGDILMFYFNMTDKDGDAIRVAAFGDVADRVCTLVEANQAYYISGGAVEESDKQFNRLSHDYELVLDLDCEVTPCHEFNMKRYPLDRVALRKRNVDHVFGIIDNVSGDIEFGAGNLMKNEVRLMDPAGRLVNMTFWSRLGGRIKSEFKGRLIVVMKKPVEEESHEYFEVVEEENSMSLEECREMITELKAKNMSLVIENAELRSEMQRKDTMLQDNLCVINTRLAELQRLTEEKAARDREEIQRKMQPMNDLFSLTLSNEDLPSVIIDLPDLDSDDDLPEPIPE